MPNTEKLSSQRILVAQQMLAERNIDLAIITPGINYRYLTNQRAVALERLTALVITQSQYWLIVPELEFNQAREFHNEVEIISWRETDDPYSMVQARTPNSKVIALDEKMPFFHVEKFQKVFSAEFLSFSPISEAMRSKKSDKEIQELTRVSAAINAVHLSIPEIKFTNRTELAVAKEIESMIREEHETVDFVIVASGPNSANPHHQPGERIIQGGDVVVIDIGGTSKSGYCSDCTRTYVVDNPDPEFVKDYEILSVAQNLGVSSAKVGITAESLDKQVRDHLIANDLGQWFVHRLGHGIGMETHEAPWLLAGNKNLLEEGNVFSIEPGFYIPGRWGARIEDIVALSGSKTLNFNDFDHSLRIVH
ncbi:MAG: M24 family metallopeptidase [Candidatus Nanopelagicales bacterium]